MKKSFKFCFIDRVNKMSPANDTKIQLIRSTIIDAVRYLHFDIRFPFVWLVDFLSNFTLNENNFKAYKLKSQVMIWENCVGVVAY